MTHSAVYGEVLAANARYAGAFDTGDLALPPSRRFAVLICMDARLDPVKDAALSGLADRLETASFDGETWSNPQHGGGSFMGRDTDRLTVLDQIHAVTSDVRRMRQHLLVPCHRPVDGFVCDVATGCLNETGAASEADRPAVPTGAGS